MIPENIATGSLSTPRDTPSADAATPATPPMPTDLTARTDVYEAFAAVMKALANGRRLELIELLAQGEHSVDALARMAGLAVTTTSAHLQSLKQSGLVKTRKERTTVYYRLAGDDVAALFVAAQRVGLSHSAALRDTAVSYLSRPGTTVPIIDREAVTSDMTVIDVRPCDEYDAGHFPGAVSIPLADLPQRYQELSASAQVVLYCRGEFCRMAREAASWLRERGIDARIMNSGMIEWRAAEDVDIDVA